MKKKSEKKLTLGKIKIASLSKTNQQGIKGGMWAQSKASVCMEQCCESDRNAQCRTI